MKLIYNPKEVELIDCDDVIRDFIPQYPNLTVRIYQEFLDIVRNHK